VVLQLFATAGIFWGYWSYREVAWTFQAFLVALASPVIVYFNACTLIPEAPASVESWRTYYFEIRKRYFIGTCLWALVVGAAASALLEMPFSHPARAIQASVFAFGVVGASSASSRVHAGIAGFLLCLALVAGFVFALPGALAK
jgi:hypothetical protein